MLKSNVPLSIKQMSKHMEECRIDVNLPIQRRSVWRDDVERKSLLLLSVIQDYPIPPLYFIKEVSEEKDEKGKNIIFWRVIDGRQRVETVTSFLEDGWRIMEECEPVVIEDKEIDISGCLFSELSEEVQQVISNFRFTINCYEEATPEDVSRMFYRLNNNVSLSKSNLAKARLAGEAEFADEMLATDFFQLCTFTKAMIKNSSDLTALIQTMMLLPYDEREKFPFDSISEKNCLSYCSDLKGGYPAEEKKVLTDVIDYLGDALEEKSKFFKKVNIPIIIKCASKAIENEIDKDIFAEWLEAFILELDTSDYKNYCSSGSVKAFNTFKRYDIMYRDMMEYCCPDEEHITRIPNFVPESQVLKKETATGVEVTK